MTESTAEYARPLTIPEAVRRLKTPDAQALAGGTELLARRTGNMRLVVDLQELPLDYIRQDADGLHIGALTSLETLARHALAAGIGAGLLARCAQLSAAYTERQSATVGGSLAVPGWHELLLAFMATDAWARLAWSGGVEVIPVDILARDRQAWLDLGTLITEVFIPLQPENARYGYQRISRTPRDRAIVAVAARLARDHRGCACSARLAVGGANRVAMRLESAESEINERALNDSEIFQVAETARRAVTPTGDWLASADYRREMTAVLVRRALNEARA